MPEKSVRTDPRNHAAEGDERIRTAVCEPSADPAYGRPTTASRLALHIRQMYEYGRWRPRESEFYDCLDALERLANGAEQVARDFAARKGA